MTTPTTTYPPLTPTPADMQETYYGVHVSSVGEDGDMVALGHVDRHRALAAFNRYARKVCGMENVANIRSASARPWLAGIEHTWAIFSDDPEWWVRWGDVTEDTPGAVPATTLSPSAVPYEVSR